MRSPGYLAWPSIIVTRVLENTLAMQEQIYCRHDLKLKKVIAAFTFEAGMKLNAAFNAIIYLLS